MRKPISLLFITTIIAVITFNSCKKEEKTPATTTPTNTGCQDGYVCFKLDGTSISKAGGGYVFADTFLFVKYEEGAKQLSIDIFGNTTGNYSISDVRKKGNARVYWFPDNTDKMYMSSKGSFNVSDYNATDMKVTGTFSGTLYKYDNNNNTFTMTDSVVISDGYFTKVLLTK